MHIIVFICIANAHTYLNNNAVLLSCSFSVDQSLDFEVEAQIDLVINSKLCEYQYFFIFSSCNSVSIMYHIHYWKISPGCANPCLLSWLPDGMIKVCFVFVSIRLRERQSICRHIRLLPHLSQAAAPSARRQRVSVHLHNNPHMSERVFWILLWIHELF